MSDIATTTSTTTAPTTPSTCRPLILPPPLAQAAHDGTLAQHRVPVIPPRSKSLVYDLSSPAVYIDRGGKPASAIEPADRDVRGSVMTFAFFGAGPYLKVPFRHVDEADWSDGRMDRVRCPWGYPEYRSRIWVKETWLHGTCPNDPHGMATCGPTDTGWRMHPDAPPNSHGWCREWKRRPSTTMPRWAARTILELTGIRCERAGSRGRGGWEWVLEFRRVE